MGKKSKIEKAKPAAVIAMLVQVARASHTLANNTEEAEHKVDPEQFKELCESLDALDQLPEPGERIYATGPAKAEALLQKQSDLLERVYTWLTEGPFDHDKRVGYHKEIGEFLGKKPVEYPE